VTANREELGERLRSAREYLGLTQQEAAEAVGLSRPAISLIESGERKLETFELKSLAGLYERPISDFTGESVREMPRDLEVLLRKAGEMTEDDRKEIMRFADWLIARRESESAK
jgi:transcriptional regulator with XRE-family HTH domain